MKKQEFIDMYPNKTNVEIAKIAGVSRQTVIHWASRLGLEKKKAGPKETKFLNKTKEELEKMYFHSNSGKLAKEFGMSRPTFLKKLKNLGIKMKTSTSISKLED